MRTLRRALLGLAPLASPCSLLAGPQPAPEPGGAGPQGLSDILDIKPPVVPLWDPSPLWWSLGALALLLAGLAAWLLWRRRKRKASAVPQLAPHEIAARDLDALGEALDLSAREFYFQLSTVFRGYLESAFALKALEMTSEELLPRLKTLPADATLQAEAKTFLRNADPVKYARREVDRKAMLQDFDFVRRFIDASKPVQPDV